MPGRHAAVFVVVLALLLPLAACTSCPSHDDDNSHSSWPDTTAPDGSATVVQGSCHAAFGASVPPTQTCLSNGTWIALQGSCFACPAHCASCSGNGTGTMSCDECAGGYELSGLGCYVTENVAVLAVVVVVLLFALFMELVLYCVGRSDRTDDPDAVHMIAVVWFPLACFCLLDFFLSAIVLALAGQNDQMPIALVLALSFVVPYVVNVLLVLSNGPSRFKVDSEPSNTDPVGRRILQFVYTALTGNIVIASHLIVTPSNYEGFGDEEGHKLFNMRLYFAFQLVFKHCVGICTKIALAAVVPPISVAVVVVAVLVNTVVLAGDTIAFRSSIS